MPTIITKREGKRGCGRRKGGGMYLVADYGSGKPCAKLPFVLTVCPCCGAGIKQTKGFTWITGKLFSTVECPKGCDKDWKCSCPFGQPKIRLGLIWIGAAYYSTPEEYLEEASRMGFSRRIGQVPRDFKVGGTWIALAHPKWGAKVNGHGDMESIPAVFYAFRPQRLEYIVKGSETDEELEALEKRGFTLVSIIPVDDDGEEEDDMDENEEEEE